MGQPAARLGDMHLCPMATPAFPSPIPHVGGPIITPGMPNVLIGGMPAATVGCMCTCVGPPDVIVKGSFTVLIGGRPAARMGDSTAHGGAITIGFPTVLIGDMGMGAASFFAAMPPTVLLQLIGGMTNQMARTVKQAVALANGAATGAMVCAKCI